MGETSCGHGESSTGWDSYTRTDTAGDLVAVIEKLGGPATSDCSGRGGRSWSVAATRNSSNESAPICPNMDRSASAGQTLGKSEPSL
jgi:hypothetical protein